MKPHDAGRTGIHLDAVLAIEAHAADRKSRDLAPCAPLVEHDRLAPARGGDVEHEVQRTGVTRQRERRPRDRLRRELHLCAADPELAVGRELDRVGLAIAVDIVGQGRDRCGDRGCGQQRDDDERPHDHAAAIGVENRRAGWWTSVAIAVMLASRTREDHAAARQPRCR
ncbi:MAG: hypothetical protein WKG01_28465 [Kofleriaceae bacterium]